MYPSLQCSSIFYSALHNTRRRLDLSPGQRAFTDKGMRSAFHSLDQGPFHTILYLLIGSQRNLWTVGLAKLHFRRKVVIYPFDLFVKAVIGPLNIQTELIPRLATIDGVIVTSRFTTQELQDTFLLFLIRDL